MDSTIDAMGSKVLEVAIMQTNSCETNGAVDAKCCLWTRGRAKRTRAGLLILTTMYDVYIVIHTVSYA